MTNQALETYEKLKGLLAFGQEDAKNLKKLGPMMAGYQAQITDAFYARLAEVPETAKMIEGRVASLKKTHAQWFAELFGGDYGEAYFERRWKVGLVHVRIGLDPHWVEAVMSMIRNHSSHAIAKEISDPLEAVRLQASLFKILDLDLLIINMSYQEDRITRVTEFTGIKRALLENIIKIPKK